MRWTRMAQLTRALAADGGLHEARQKYLEAVDMDLLAADRAELVRRLGTDDRGDTT